MIHWSKPLKDICDRYINNILDTGYKIELLDNKGNTLGKYTHQTNNNLADEYDSFQIFKNNLLPTNVNEPIIISSNPSSSLCAIRMAIDNLQSLKWVIISYTHSKKNSNDNNKNILALCKATSNLIEDYYINQEKLRRSRYTVLQQEAIINHISDGLLVLDNNGILQYCNEPASKLLNINMRTSIGLPISEVLDFAPIISKVFTDGKGYIDREHFIESPTVKLHVIDTALPIRDENGNIISVVNTFRKLDRVKRLSYKIMMDRPLYNFDDLLGESTQLKVAIDAGKKASKTDTSVVLYGESGTGKELFAQAIHTYGERLDGPFIAINCAAIPRDLVESELFGYTSGSFTGADIGGKPGKFELATGGTIFLDEIAEMSLEVQAKLLRVLQEKRVLRIGAASSTPVDVRIIAASNKRLTEMVKEGSFREDLFYRLNVIDIEIPALRNRTGDIEILVKHFLYAYSSRINRLSIQLSNHAMNQLISYSWPGNIRQLQNIIERLVSLSDTDTIEVIPNNWLETVSDQTTQFNDNVLSDALYSMKGWERHAILHTLKSTDFNVTKSAEILGISRPTMYSKLKQFGLERNLH